MKNEIITSKQSGLTNQDSMTALIEKFISEQDVCKNSKLTYTRQIKQFFSWISEAGIDMSIISRSDILRYKEYLQEKLAALTVSGYIVTVRLFFQWAESNKLYIDITKNIKGAKRQKGFRKDPLNLTQIKDLLAGIDRQDLQGQRDYAIINLLIHTGLRTIEVARADIADIRQEGGQAVLNIQGKGRDSKDEFVILTDGVLKPIQVYLKNRGHAAQNESLFASCSYRNRGGRITTKTISRLVKEHLKNADIISERITAHSLRHTAITLSLLAGATIQEAQILGRHSSMDTTLIYAHNIDRVKNAPEKLIESYLAAN